MMNTALTIAGSDCSGGAGIQADLKTFSAHGLFGMSVVTSVVAENTSRVLKVYDLPTEVVAAQIDAVMEDIPPDAVKIGMLSSASIMRVVADKLHAYKIEKVVIDPVMCAKNGDALMAPEAMETLIHKVLPLAYMLTPNIPEAEQITGLHITNVQDMERAAKAVHSMGCRYSLIKGGHHIGDAVDVLYDGKGYRHFVTARIDTKNTHGTGCTYSSAIASGLALGNTVSASVEDAKQYITTAIRHSLALGKGHGPTNHFYNLYKNGLEKKK